MGQGVGFGQRFKGIFQGLRDDEGALNQKGATFFNVLAQLGESLNPSSFATATREGLQGQLAQFAIQNARNQELELLERLGLIPRRQQQQEQQPQQPAQPQPGPFDAFLPGGQPQNSFPSLQPRTLGSAFPPPTDSGGRIKDALFRGPSGFAQTRGDVLNSLGDLPRAGGINRFAGPSNFSAGSGGGTVAGLTPEIAIAAGQAGASRATVVGSLTQQQRRTKAARDIAEGREEGAFERQQIDNAARAARAAGSDAAGIAKAQGQVRLEIQKQRITAGDNVSKRIDDALTMLAKVDPLTSPGTTQPIRDTVVSILEGIMADVKSNPLFEGTRQSKIDQIASRITGITGGEKVIAIADGKSIIMFRREAEEAGLPFTVVGDEIEPAVVAGEAMARQVKREREIPPLPTGTGTTTELRAGGADATRIAAAIVSGDAKLSPISEEESLIAAIDNILIRFSAAGGKKILGWFEDLKRITGLGDAETDEIRRQLFLSNPFDEGEREKSVRIILNAIGPEPGFIPKSEPIVGRATGSRR